MTGTLHEMIAHEEMTGVLHGMIENMTPEGDIDYYTLQYYTVRKFQNAHHFLRFFLFEFDVGIFRIHSGQ